MLARWVDAVRDGLLGADVAEALKSRNQAHKQNRAGMIWFCGDYVGECLRGERSNREARRR